jgi:hypothetical protein
MDTFKVEVSDVIEARPEEIYAVISDYHIGHPAILPKPYFTELTVEKGGQGAGSVVWTKMKVMGQTYTYHQVVTEPEPGRVLVETDMDTGQFSTFTLDPLDGGKRTKVTISAVFPAKPGFVGFMEKLMNPPVSRRIFRKELVQLADYLKDKKATSTR